MSEGLILGIGEILWDELPSGRMPGGAPYNFAYHAQYCGEPSAIVSRIGADAEGEALRAAVRASGVQDQYLQVDGELPTGNAHVTLDDHGSPSYTLTPDVAWDALAGPIVIDQPVRAICFGTLAQRHPISRHTIRQLVQDHPDALVVYDLNLRDPCWTPLVIEASLAMSRWLKINRDELTTLCRWLRLPGVSIAEQVTALRETYELELICVTSGAEGCYAQTATENHSVDGVEAVVVDTVGAGDAFTAALVVSTLRGRLLAHALDIANRYAARVAGTAGATPRVPIVDIDGLS